MPESTSATCCRAGGETAAAIDALVEAVGRDPTSALAQHNLGTLLALAGRPAEAATALAEAARLRPDYVDAYFKLGHVLYSLRRYDEAVAALEAAARLKPEASTTRSLLGTVYQAQRRWPAAIDAYREAIRLSPRNAAAHYNLGTAYWALGRAVEAIACYQDALGIDPTFFKAQVNLAGSLSQAYRPDEAQAAAEAAIALDPRSSVAVAHLAAALQTQGKMAEAIETLRRAIALDPTDARHHSNLLFALNCHPAYDSASVFAEHRAWAAQHSEPLTAACRAPHANDRSSERRLRIGYVSAHFRLHAVSFFIEPVIAAHERQQVEIFLYGDVEAPDATTDRYRAMDVQWRDIAGQPDELVADRIREDRIDILVDLAGHIGGNRLLVFARKPAPVQVTYIGYQNTTGMSAMDYRITDAHADPPGATDAYYTEQLVRLPGSFFCYQPPADAPPVNELPALSRGQVTFASLNHINKLTDEAYGAWARILRAVPESRLMVLAYTPGELERRIRQRMASEGIEPGRIEVVDRRPHADYMQLFAGVDIALDTFPFNGHTTVCDALWMGVPSIMMEGDRYASRFGGSGVLALGLGELIAHDVDEYVAIAAALAGDLPRLAELRRTLRGRLAASPLADAAVFARKLEAAYRQMWRTWCERGD